MFGVQSYDLISFGIQTFDRCKVWLIQQWPYHLVWRHLADIMFGWHNYGLHLVNRHLTDIEFGWYIFNRIIWSTDTELKTCLVGKAMISSFGWQNFDWHRVWSTDIMLTKYLVNIAIIGSTDISPRQYLVDTGMTIDDTIVDWKQNVCWPKFFRPQEAEEIIW